MRTIRDYITSQASIPAPPPSATHALVWEPYGPSRSQWALVALDDYQGADGAILDGPADIGSAELAGGASGLLGHPVGLSPRIEVDGEFAYYVTPAGGGRR